MEAPGQPAVWATEAVNASRRPGKWRVLPGSGLVG